MWKEEWTVRKPLELNFHQQQQHQKKPESDKVRKQKKNLLKISIYFGENQKKRGELRNLFFFFVLLSFPSTFSIIVSQPKWLVIYYHNSWESRMEVAKDTFEIDPNIFTLMSTLFFLPLLASLEGFLFPLNFHQYSTVTFFFSVYQMLKWTAKYYWISGWNDKN